MSLERSAVLHGLFTSPCRKAAAARSRPAAFGFLGIFLSGCGGAALAAGYNGEDFSLRLPAALTQFSPYGDVAGVGGASVGSPYSSSVNPAAAGWSKMTGAWHASFSPQYSALIFDNGSRMNVFAETLQWDGQEAGVFQLTAAQERSNHAPTREGLNFGFDLNNAQLVWGRKFGENFALGAGFNYNGSDTTYDVGSASLSKTTSHAYGGRVGSLFRVTERCLAGLVVDYSQGPAQTTVHDVFGSGLGDLYLTDKGSQALVRAGISYEYVKDSRVYFDYHYGTFWNGTGSLTVNRFLLGVEQALCKAVFLRGGTAVDTCGNVAFTGGVGLYPTEWLSLDLAYQYNMFPELIPDFGRANTVTASLTVQF